MAISKSEKDSLLEQIYGKSRMVSIFVVHLSGFVFALGYSIGFTGFLPYLSQVFQFFI